MSFWTVAKQDATDIEQAVVAGCKTALNYVDNVVVHEFIPELETVLEDALDKFSQQEIAAAIAAIKAAV